MINGRRKDTITNSIHIFVQSPRCCDEYVKEDPFGSIDLAVRGHILDKEAMDFAEDVPPVPGNMGNGRRLEAATDRDDQEPDAAALFQDIDLRYPDIYNQLNNLNE